MASLMETAMRRAGEGRLDLPVALLMGAASGVMAFLAPVALLEDLAMASGLAGILPFAAPPLGMKAQFGFAAVAALAGFAIVLAVMRMLDRVARRTDPARAATVHQDDEDELPAPRMRRRDLHPDAPVRRPLSALRDLGDPDAELVRRVVKRPVPLDPLPAPAPDPQPVEAVAPEPAPEVPLTNVTPAELQPELVEANAHSIDAAPHPWSAEPEAEPARAPAPAVEAAPAPSPDPRRAPAEDSIGELVARLERALDRRQAPAARPEPAAPVQEPVKQLDDRLRSALEHLKRFTPQAG